MMVIDRYWKYKNTKKLIDEMGASDLFPAAIECYKRMFGNNRRAHFAQYRSAISRTPKTVVYWQNKKKEAEKWLEFYSTKLEYLDERAQTLGIELSDNMQELRKDYASIRKHKQRKSARNTSEQSNSKDGDS